MNRIDREINALADAVRALDESTGDSVAWTPEDLAGVGDAIESLSAVRDAIMCRLRADAHTWAAIATTTGVPISTWRRRHARHQVLDRSILDR